MKLEMTKADVLLLVLPLTTRQQTGLIDRAAFVARRKSLDILVYTPALSVAPPHTEMSVNIDTPTVDTTVELARAHCKQTIELLLARKTMARGHVDVRQSPLRGVLDLVEREQPQLVMISAGDYDEWSERSLTDNGLLERCAVPIWIENGASSDAAVVGAIELDPNGHDISPLDHRVAEEASATARDLGAALHVVHAITRQAEVPRLVEAAAPDSMIDQAYQEIENSHVRLAHEVANRHGIAKENTHLQRGDITDAIVDTADAVDAGVIVMGASRRNGLTRLLFESPPHRLLDRIHADVVVVNRDAA